MIFTILSPIAYVAGRLVAFKRKSIYEDQGLEIIEHIMKTYPNMRWVFFYDGKQQDRRVVSVKKNWPR
jgi:hypothetical protein